MIKYLGEEVDLGDEFLKKKKKLNSSGLWAYGYNKEFDVVVISRTGKIGKVFNIQGVNIALPAVPKPEKILNYDKPRDEQIFSRPEMPKGLNYETMYEATYSRFIDREFNRRYYGVWCMIGGNATYIVGTYYFGISWIREAREYPQYRQIQNELMIFWEACKADRRCYGMQYIKNRRMGASLLAIMELLDSGTIVEDALLGIMSKSGGDSKKIFNRLIKAFKRLPCFFRPPWDGTNTPKKELILDTPTKRKKVGESTTIDDGGLGTIINYESTTMNSYDGDAIYRSLLDESGKYPKEVPFSEYWDIVKTSHTAGVRITGKSMVVSTVNKLSAGGSEYQNVYEKSDVNNRDENDETKSGLYSIFIPAEYCMEGMFDKFGFSIVNDPEEPVETDEGQFVDYGTITYLERKAAGLEGDPVALNEFRRQFPREVYDAFRDESGAGEFDVVKLQDQMRHNSEELNDRWYNNTEWLGNDKVVRGNLAWKDGVQDSEVVWRPDKAGRFFVHIDAFPPQEYRNKVQKIDNFGLIEDSPLCTHIGCFGVDPYNRDRAVDGRGSLGAIIGTTGTHTDDRMPRNAMFLQYLDRPRKIELFFEDVIMAMLFWSMPMLAELANERFLQYVVDRGYRRFSLNNPFKRPQDLSDTEKKLGGAPPQDSKIATAQFYAAETFVNDHVGYAVDSTHRQVGTIADMPFTPTLRQLSMIDLSKKRTKFDAYIGLTLSLLGNQRRKVKAVDAKKEKIIVPFTRYSQAGNVSKVKS